MSGKSLECKGRSSTGLSRSMSILRGVSSPLLWLFGVYGICRPLAIHPMISISLITLEGTDAGTLIPMRECTIIVCCKVHLAARGGFT